jgi:membrane-bound serine protease (ClpP class)
MRRSKFLARVLVGSLALFSLLPWGLALLAAARAQSGAHVNVLQLEGVIAPFTAQYVIRGIETGEVSGAEAVIIQMNTPGGLMNSMDEIITKIVNSRVPVVVYVAPRNARAGSAGVFITMAAHVAAMAPLTNIGAAHPVGGQGEQIEEDLRAKVTNDAVARIRRYAVERGRNADWAERAVRESVSVSAEEALQLNVIDLMAENLEELLDRIDGRAITTSQGQRILHTRGARPVPIPMSWSESFLQVITDPNIAYILLSLGTIALIAEFYNPGSILPGVTGVIFLVLAFTAFGVLKPDWSGVGLIILALILFIADLKVQGYALSVGGAVAFVLGSILLFPRTPELPGMPPFSVNPWLIGLMTTLWAGFFVWALTATIRAHRTKLSSGVHLLAGEVGLAQTDLSPRGVVWVRSEEWSAEAIDGTIPRGARVRVVEVIEGVQLRVTQA